MKDLLQNDMSKCKMLVDVAANQTQSCSNYMEKYMPIYIQRQISQCVEYVFPDRETKWRLNWYNELKIPLLTALLLNDDGQARLEERIASLHALVMDNILPSLPDSPDATTNEEAFVLTGLKSRILHSKAKLYIMDMIGQIKEKQKRLPGQHIRVDSDTVSVEQLFSVLCEQLSKDDPDL